MLHDPIDEKPTLADLDEAPRRRCWVCGGWYFDHLQGCPETEHEDDELWKDLLDTVEDGAEQTDCMAECLRACGGEGEK